ncbi:GatB/YqeY domain-containing protein [Actinoplanes siamensis]|uniref:GatB/YqeY domain-containing protein n=1 Tax=Actinoplanes siamensis TaxID=1223317 RepID=A0A919N4U5_9ACTN|nr:hypothetical protein [Actinoplanes siamensis]GIF04453.1 hypothetical protein Asi03nite_19910 [Actinoplanes siamensis]
MLRDRLQAALLPAMKARDKAAVSALRSALAAIENAAAVTPRDAAFGLPATGLGVTEVPRREQDDAEIERIVRAEIDERRAAAAEYDRLGREAESVRLRAEADVLDTQLSPGTA